jgi:hypothetical protein
MNSTPPAFAGRDPVALRRHLSRYWKMEAGNVLLVPIIVWLMVWSAGDAPGAYGACRPRRAAGPRPGETLNRPAAPCPGLCRPAGWRSRQSRV